MSSAQFSNAYILNSQGQFVWGSLNVTEGRIVGHCEAAPIDLQGGYVVPGLWDNHIHLLLLARAMGQVDLSSCCSATDLLSRLAGAEGDWVEGHGWNQSHWPDPALPRRQELDEACRGRPCFLTRADLHSALVNTAALAEAGITADTPQPAGGHIDFEGGILCDRAMLSINLALPHGERLERLLRRVVAQLHSYGIVGVCDQRLKDFDDGPLAWDTYRRLRLPLRIHCNRGGHEDLSQGPRFGEGDEWVRCGHVKFFSDGSLGSRTARMRAPYLGYPGERGLWLTEPQELAAGMERARTHGFPISVHAIGDEAVGLVAGLNPDRIEHVQILAPEDLPRIQAVASMQPVHLLDDRLQSEQLLGQRSAGYYRLRSLHAQGTRLSFGSDAPVASPDPWLGLQAACLRQLPGQSPWYPEECLDRLTALRAYTDGMGWEGHHNLEIGSVADFCLLDRDPLTCPWPPEIQVLRTVVAGQTTYVKST